MKLRKSVRDLALKSLVEDAERYRWLRDQSQGASLSTPVAVAPTGAEDAYSFVFGLDLDEAVDQAMTSRSSEP